MVHTARILCLLLGISLAACLGDDDGTAVSDRYSEPQVVDTTPTEKPVAQSQPFYAVPIKNFKAFTVIRDSIGDHRTELLLKLNRRDRKHIRKNDTLIMPAVFDEMQISPYPSFIESAQHIPKLILVSRRVQALGAYEYGRLVRWAPTSTGKRSTPTPDGLFHANWKEHMRVSSVDSTWIMPWCVNISRSGIAIHAFGVPGYPASHSCVRLPDEDAEWIFHWVDLRKGPWEGKPTVKGTPVIIFEQYAFGQRQPWKQLLHDPFADKVTKQAIDSVIALYMHELIEEPKDSVLSAGL